MLKIAPLCFVVLTLSGCRCIEGCLAFFKGHASKGSDAWVSRDVPVQSLTLEQFKAADKNRGVPPDVLERRFRVADANDDGWLTPQEITAHQVAARKRDRLE